MDDSSAPNSQPSVVGVGVQRTVDASAERSDAGGGADVGSGQQVNGRVGGGLSLDGGCQLITHTANQRELCRRCEWAQGGEARMRNKWGVQSAACKRGDARRVLRKTWRVEVVTVHSQRARA